MLCDHTRYTPLASRNQIQSGQTISNNAFNASSSKHSVNPPSVLLTAPNHLSTRRNGTHHCWTTCITTHQLRTRHKRYGLVVLHRATWQTQQTTNYHSCILCPLSNSPHQIEHTSIKLKIDQRVGDGLLESEFD